MAKVWRWVPALAWMGVIFWFSSQPTTIGTGINSADFLLKKTAHIVVYAVLFILLTYALGKKNMQWAFLLGLIYAFSDEIHQLFTPGRTGMLRDVLTFDTIGLLVGALVVDKLISWKR